MAYPKNSPDDIGEMEDISLETKPEDNPNTLSNIMVFANKHRELSKEAATYEELLSALDTEIKDIEEVKLPLILNTLKIKEFKLTDGSVINLNPVFQGSIVKKDANQRSKQLKWVTDSLGGPLIKTEVTLKFGRGEEKQLQLLLDTLKEIGFDYTMKEGIHASTLSSFIKEKVAKGEEVPFDDLKWRIFDKAEIKVPGEKPKRKKKKVEEDDD